jgi:hypothetical protein
MRAAVADMFPETNGRTGRWVKWVRRQLLGCLLLALPVVDAIGQDVIDPEARTVVQASGFLDMYYGFDFNQPASNTRPDFLFNHHRHNKIHANLALLQLHLDQDRYRANLGVMGGTYAQRNLAHEPKLLRHVYAANMGVALNQRSSLWLDAGVMPSHIGFESAISADNPTLTRSLAAENSPYYLAGARLSWDASPNWQFAALVVSGWQRIRPATGNSLPGIGTQVTYTLDARFSLNWSTFIGTDDPDRNRRLRIFNNWYGTFQATDRLSLFAGFDMGMQQTAKGSSAYDVWFTPVVIARYRFADKWHLALRGEYYADPDGVIVAPETGQGFSVVGLSANIDYAAFRHMLCRMEARWLGSNDAVLPRREAMARDSMAVIGSIAVRF